MTKRLNYTIGVNADTSKFDVSLNQAFQSLQKLSTLNTGTAITSDLKDAVLAAQALQQSLEGAINVNTGKLDLSKFAASLDKSKISLQEYADKLQAIGPIGEQAFLDVAAAVAKAEIPLKRSSKLLDSLWVTMKNTVRWQVTSSALNSFVGALQTAYGYSKSLDASLNNIRIVSEKSADDMKEFAVQANKAAKALSTTTTDYTDASLIYYQQGLKDEEVLERTDTTIKMANVAGQTAQVVSDQMTAVWNNFYDGSKSIEYYADVMVKLGAATASSTDEIAQGLEKFAAVGNTVGLSYEYATSALATITSNTRQSADVVGTALKTIFARIQDLELGETLDDGTTLGTYSKALEAVGINVLDANGQLVKMDTILDELGEKWGSLSNAQQVALAQAIAGVRQYNQIVSLMDNWDSGDADSMQANLEYTRKAEGELQRQADVYAESWEAARKRVTAAAEDIYDSLINPDFYIGLDDTITPVLSGIAQVIDAMGGMSGVILALGRTFTAVYHNQITKGLQDIAYNFNVMIGKADVAQRKIKEDFGNKALNMVTNSSSTSTPENIARETIQAEDIEMQNLLNSLAREMTEEQMKQLSGYKDIITSIKKMALEYDQVAIAHQEETERLTEEISAQQGVAKQSKEYKNTLESIRNILKGIKIPDLSFRGGERSIQSMLKAFNKLSSTASGLERLHIQMKALSEEDQKNTKLLDTLKVKYKELTGIDLSGGTTKENLIEIQEIINTIEKALEKLYGTLSHNHVPEETLERLRTATAGVGEATQNNVHATNIAEEAVADYRLKVYQATIQQETWADKIVNGANQLMQLGMVIQSIQNLGSIWNDDDLTTGEKVIQTLTNVGMLLPQTISLISSATKARVSYNAVVVEGTEAEAANKIASQLNSRQKVIETREVNGNTVAVIKNTTAWYANPLTWILAGITAIVAVFTIYNTVLEENTKKRRENAESDAEAAIKQAEAIREEAEANESLYKEYITLRSANDKSVEGKESLRKKTKELCEALGLEDTALSLLNDDYDILNKKIAEANKKVAQQGLEQTSLAIKAQQNFMVEKGAEYDSYLAGQEGYESLSYKINFSGGFNGADETDIKDYLSQALSDTDLIYTTSANTGFQVYVENSKEFLDVYERIQAAQEEIASNDAYDGIRQESEVYSNAKIWLSEMASEYEKLAQLRQDQITYAKQLAEAEGALANQDLANVTTIEEYEEIRANYIQTLKGVFEDYDLTPADVDNIDEYFQQLADTYLSGYENLEKLVINSNASDEIAQKLGKYGKDIVSTLLKQGYNISTLVKVDWDTIAKEYQDGLNELEQIGFRGAPLTSKIGNIDFKARGKIVWDEESIAQWENELESLGYEAEDLLGTTSTVMGTSSNYEGQEIVFTPLLSTSDGLQPLSQDTIDEYIYGLIDKAKDIYGEDWARHILQLDAEGLEFEGQQISNIIADIGDTALITGEAMHYLGNDGAIMLDIVDGIQTSLQEIAASTLTSFDSVDNLIDKLQNGKITYEDIADDEDYKTLLNDLDILKTAYPELEAAQIELSKTWEVGTQKFAEALEQVQDKLAEIKLNDLAEDAADAKQELEDFLGDDWKVAIEADPDGFNSAIDKILDAEYAIDIEIHSQAEQEFESISNAMSNIQDQASKIGENFVVSANDIRELNNTFPGIIENMQAVGDGSVQLNQQVVENAIAAAKGEVAADAEATVTKLENQATLLRSKQQVYQQMATAAAVLAGAETESEMTADEAMAELSAGLSELEQLNSNAATTVKTENQQITADSSNENGEIVAGNWDSAFSSAAQSSAEFARTAIANMKAVTDENAGAVTTGNFKVNYSGASGVSEEAATLQETQDILDTPESVTAEKWAELAAKYQNLADSTGAAANDIEGMIAQIGASTTELDNLLTNVGNGNGSGGSSSGKTLDKEDLKTLDEVEDRYHEINRQLERQSDLLDDIDNATDRAYGKDKLAKFEEGIKALEKEQELLNSKLNDAEDYLTQDAAAVKKYFSGAQIDSNGEITNYEELLRLNMEMYNAEVEKYNLAVAGKTLTDEESEALKAQLEIAKTLYEIRLAALQQYESTLDTIRDVTDKIEENARSIADKKLEKIKHKLEIVIDVKSMYDSLRDLEKEIAESFGDALTHGLQSAYLSAEGAKAEAALLPDYENQYAELKALYESTTDDADRQAIMEEIQDLQGKVIDSASALVEWANSIEDIVPDAVDAAAERFAAFTDQLEHNTSVLDTIKELYALQGVTYKTMDGFNRLQKVSQEKLEAQVASAVLQRSWYEEAEARLAEAQAKLDSLNGDETDIRYDAYKKARDAYLEEFNEAQEAYLSSAKEAMETAQEMYTQQIEKAVYEFGQAISDGVGLDLLQEQYDHYIEENERYLDTVNEAYEVASWYNKLQKDIDESTNSAQTQRLKALQEEIDARRENNTLSEYDLKILEAKYNVLQAQMALEDAQNAKNNLQLVRDSQGNWNYQYTADQDKIADAEQGLLDAQNDWYNIAKQQVTDITGEIVTMWKECQDKVKEIYTDDNLTYEEKLAAAEEVQKYYSEKAKYLEEEKNIAIKDMNEAGSEALIGIAQTTGEETADLIGEFTNTYADKLGEMTQTNVDFEERLNELLGQAKQNFLDYQDTVDNVAEETGTTLDDLAEETDKVSDATDILRERGLDAADSLWNQIDAAQNASDSYLDLADSIWEAVYAMQALAAEQASYAASQAGASSGSSSSNKNYDASTDYSGVIMDGIANGWLQYGSNAYNELFQQRENKIDGEGLSEDYYISRGDEADDRFSGAGSVNQYDSEEEWKDKLHNLGISGFATGGYTGTFDDARLAFLHEKELVLNQEDTANILAAVHAVRDFGPNLLESIEKALDNNTIAAMALMGAKLTTSMVAPQSDVLEQTVHIDKVEFPNVTSRTEIEEAFISLTNDAAQWARRRT